MLKIQLPWPADGGSEVPALWLRDNCPCAECRVTATAEHRIVIGSQPEHLAPRQISQVGDVLHVDWGDHQSSYDAAWLQRIRAEAFRSPPVAEPWKADLELPVFDNDQLDEPDGFVAMCDEFARFGVTLIRGVGTTPGTAEGWISRWAPVREVPFGRIHDVFVDPAGYNVAHTAEALPPHNDMASLASPPSGQVIHMLVNDADGGETIVVDGWAVCSQLRRGDLDVLSRIPASFRQFSDTIETWAKAPLIRRASDGAIAHFRFSNQLLQPMDPLQSDTEEFYEAYHRLTALVLDQSFHHQFRMSAGDALLLHGHRVLHGRSSFQPASGARHLQDVYFESEDLMNTAFRIRHHTTASGS